MRKLLLVPLSLVVAVVVYIVWSSSPNVPLVLSREDAIGRAAAEATRDGKRVWTRVESKLITYHEWNAIARITPGLGYVDTTDPSALVWVVAYRGPMLSVSADFCEWSMLAFRADDRITSDWSASECGQGERPRMFDLLPDRSWFRF